MDLKTSGSSGFERNGLRLRLATLAIWWPVIVLSLFFVLNTLDRMVVNLVVDNIKTDFLVSDFEVSLLLGFAFGIFYALFGLPIGWLVDRVSRRMIIVVGVTIWSLATIACGLVDTFPQLLVARIVLAVGEATLGPSAHSLIADIVPKHRLATAMSIYTLGGVVGVSASFALGGAAVSYFETLEVVDIGPFVDLRAWQAVFVIFGIPGIFLAHLAWTIREPKRVDSLSTPAATALFPFLRKRIAVLLCFLGSFGVAAIVINGVVSWIPAYMSRAFGWSTQDIGGSLGLVNLVTVGLGTLIAGAVVDHLTTRGYRDATLRVFVVATIIALPCGIAAFNVSDPMLFLVLVSLFKLFGFTFVGTGAASMQMIAPSELRGRMAALFLLVYYLVGFGGGATVVALFTDYVFHDPDLLGYSLTATAGILLPAAVVSAIFGLPHMRRASFPDEASVPDGASEQATGQESRAAT